VSTPALLDPAVVHRLGRLRLRLRRRIDGRFVGGHPARGYGSSQDFTDYREYAAGDDPRLLDPHAWARHRKLLIRQYAAEDTAAVTIVVDGSRSMTFAGKARAARQVAGALAVIATSSGDRVRVAVAGTAVTTGPWYAGGAGMAAALARLGRELPAGGGDEPAGNGGAPAGNRGTPAGDRGRPPGPAHEVDLVAALDRIRRQGQRGPMVVISDLLTPAWPQVIARLGADRGDALLVHLLGPDEIEPAITGDVRLVDAETGRDVELAVSDSTLARYRATRDAWFDGIARACGARGVSQVRHVAGQAAETLIAVELRRLGWVA